MLLREKNVLDTIKGNKEVGLQVDLLEISQFRIVSRLKAGQQAFGPTLLTDAVSIYPLSCQVAYDSVTFPERGTRPQFVTARGTIYDTE